MRRCQGGCLFVLSVVIIVSCGGAASAADITSIHGRSGPAYQSGQKPSDLGWGDDERAYPDKLVVNPVDLAELVWVPAGRFAIGSTKQVIDWLWDTNKWDNDTKKWTMDEYPQWVIITSGYWVYRHEVTMGQFERFIEATGAAPPVDWNFYRRYQRLPVMNVNWYQAAEYARWANADLPTEAEWEYAARGRSSYLFPWGNQWDRNRCDTGEYWAQSSLPSEKSRTDWFESIGAEPGPQWLIAPEVVAKYLTPVGSFPDGASWCGALDMAGSVYEWCADRYWAYTFQRGPQTDPTGPDGEANTNRILKGGTWTQNGRTARSANRPYAAPDFVWVDIGFRPVVR